MRVWEERNSTFSLPHVCAAGEFHRCRLQPCHAKSPPPRHTSPTHLTLHLSLHLPLRCNGYRRRDAESARSRQPSPAQPMRKGSISVRRLQLGCLPRPAPSTRSMSHPTHTHTARFDLSCSGLNPRRFCPYFSLSLSMRALPLAIIHW